MNTLLLLCCKSFCENLTGANEKITLIICGSVVLIVIIALGTSLIWYWPKRTNKKKNTKEETTNNQTSDSSKNSESIEKERWFSLKKEYQRMALDYIWERALGSNSEKKCQESGEDDSCKYENRLDPSGSCENDTYLKFIKRFIGQIDKKLNIDPLFEKTTGNEAQNVSPEVKEEPQENNQ